ncbi:hypothetical protein BDQ94DRAFT_53122 [Aspergillus welwitschiae]|uniref:Uncharacterized protein n=1 Tax=Aspergillus welwitschiae TaxID=1341132 RepID=A0A3F3PYB5_9EURO|nr:hypothetical protein BDQ94DRAFT_53122 [Aspergillus welwitschiae]RDH31909.1 hypothetical protein BDQ94DRAFT_53122 [Aspergillus welwitschiae]
MGCENHLPKNREFERFNIWSVVISGYFFITFLFLFFTSYLISSFCRIFSFISKSYPHCHEHIISV